MNKEKVLMNENTEEFDVALGYSDEEFAEMMKKSIKGFALGLNINRKN